MNEPLDPPDDHPDEEPPICPFCMEWDEDCRCDEPQEA